MSSNAPPPPRAASAARVLVLRHPVWEGSAAPGDSRKVHLFIAGVLGREIVGGIHPAGSVLPATADLCARFDVSRTALREAYSQLSSKSLIAAKPRVGVRVRERAEWNMLDPEVLSWLLQAAPSEKTVADLFEVRQMIEPAAAALAASGRDPRMIEKATDAVRRMREFKDGAGGLIAADVDFHMAVLGSADNPFLTALGGLIRTSLQFVFAASWEGAARIREDRLRQHEAVIEAIRARDPEAARARMGELIRDSFNDFRFVEPASAYAATRERGSRAQFGADDLRGEEERLPARALEGE